jgi:two-component system response regulator YesN
MKSVLFVDDHAMTIENIPLLCDGEYTLFTARDGKEAWEIITARRVDLLITDIEMPVMDGMELMRRVKAEFPALYVVAMTGHDLKQGDETVWFDRVELKPHPDYEGLIEECLARLG